MQTIALHQAKNQLSALVHAVEQGEEVVLTRHGKRVARIVAEVDDGGTGVVDVEQQRREAMELLNAFRSKVRPGPKLDWIELRDAGRKY